MFLKAWDAEHNWLQDEVALVLKKYSNFINAKTPDLTYCADFLATLAKKKVEGINLVWCIPKLRLCTMGSNALVIKGQVTLNNQHIDIEESAELAKYSNVMQACTAALSRVLYKVVKAYALDYNAVQLTHEVGSILRTNNVKQTFEFAVGSTLFNLSDNHMGIGLSERVLMHLIDLFGDTITDKNSYMAAEVLTTFENLPCVVEAIRRKTLFSKLLDFYTWKSAKTLIRAAYHTNVKVARNKIGYYQDGDYLALVDVRICDEAELTEMQNEYGEESVLVSLNEEPRSSDYVKVRSYAELAAVKQRFDKHEGCTYRIEPQEDGTYHLVYRQFIGQAYRFSPTNMKTYERLGSDNTDLMQAWSNAM